MNDILLQIAAKLKELGVREFGAPVWQKQSETPEWSGVSVPKVDTRIVNNVQLSSIQIPAADGGFFPVRLAKGVPNNKQTYDIFLYKAVRDFPATEQEKKRFPNIEPIKVGAVTAMAH